MQEAETISQNSIICGDDASVSGRAEILGGEKTETT
jgi:hypothetical protein